MGEDARLIARDLSQTEKFETSRRKRKMVDGYSLIRPLQLSAALRTSQRHIRMLLYHIVQYTIIPYLKVSYYIIANPTVGIYISVNVRSHSQLSSDILS